jgi:heat shock protein HslJ
MSAFRSCAVFLLFAALAAACDDSPASPTADQIAGTWALVSIQRAGQAVQPKPTGATYSLTLSEDRLSTRADCNTCTGTANLLGMTLTAGPALACTRAACATAAFENAYTTLLAGESTVALVDGTLILSSTRGELRFTR